MSNKSEKGLVQSLQMQPRWKKSSECLMLSYTNLGLTKKSILVKTLCACPLLTDEQAFWLRPCVPAFCLPMNPSGDAQAGCELSTQEVVQHPRSRPWIPQFPSSLPPWAPRLSRPPQRWSPAAAAVFLRPWPASPPLSVSPAVMVRDDHNSNGQ